MDFLFIIVIYSKQIDESLTLKTLLTNNIANKNTVLIWNNGPNSIKNEFDINYRMSNYHLVETLTNEPLSLIYNTCIKKHCDSQYFVILDDDTELTKSYFNALNNLNDIDLLLPHIVDGNTKKIVAPTDNGRIITVDGEISLKKPGSVSSGMVISKRLTKLVQKYYKGTIFDENFALYGIDSTFLMRVKKINKKEKIIAISKGSLIHSLSNSLQEEQKIKSFRQKEMSYDIALTLRHYPSFGKLKTFLRDLKQIHQGNSLLTKKEIFYCLWKGKHPRCYKK